MKNYTRETTCDILSHTLNYGSGIFEGIRFYETKRGVAIFRLDDHLERFFYSAKTINLKIAQSKEELKKTIIQLVKKSELKEGYIRPIGFFGGESMDLNPKKCSSQIAISITEWKYLSNKKIKAKISKYKRLSPEATNLHAKITGHYFNSSIPNIHAQKEGFDEAILMDEKGYVSEAASENLFMVKNNRLFTPKKKYIFPGLTRATIIKIAKDNKIEVVEENITKGRLLSADEVFLTGTAAEITEIQQINGKIFQVENPVTEFFKKTYKDLVHGKIKKYNNWLTYV